MPRVLVLGANGFIGRQVVASLAASDWARPVAATRRAPAPSCDSNIDTVQLDALDAPALARALEGIAGVVNCVTGDAATIVNGARTLFAATAQASPVPRVVHLSSMAAYGSASGVVDESAPLLGDLDSYSMAKARAERIAGEFGHVVCLRPGIVYGPGSAWWSDRIARLLMAGRLGDLGVCGNGRCNLVHVQDVADAVLAALRLPDIASAAFNLSTPSPPTWNEYFMQYARALQTPLAHIPHWRLTLELKALVYPYKLREFGAQKLLSARWRPAPPLRPWLARLCQHDITLSTQRAESVLNMQWRPLHTGMQQTAVWFLSGGRT